MQQEKGITKQGTKLFLQAALDSHKAYMKLYRVSQKTVDR